MSPKRKKKFQMSPAEYRNFLGKVNLKSIVLTFLTVKTDRKKTNKNMKADIKLQNDFAIVGPHEASVSVTYELAATKTIKKDAAVEITATYEVILSAEEELTKEFLEIYSEINVHLNTWPYFRELVQSMTQRAGLPPLTLPLFRPE